MSNLVKSKLSLEKITKVLTNKCDYLYPVILKLRRSLNISEFIRLTDGNLSQPEAIFPAHSVFMWSLTKKIYNIDPDIKSMLLTKGVSTDNTLTDIFKRLPDFTTTVVMDEVIDGVYVAMVSCNVTEIDTSDTPLITFSVWVTDPNGEIADRSFTSRFISGSTLMEDSISSMALVAHADFYTSVITRSLPLFMYLCSDNFSKDTGVKHQRTLNTVKGVFTPPAKASMVKVGSADGDKVRAFNRQLSVISDSTRTVKPHIRRAHWHSYKVNGVYAVKFLPNIFVNM